MDINLFWGILELIAVVLTWILIGYVMMTVLLGIVDWLLIVLRDNEGWIGRVMRRGK